MPKQLYTHKKKTSKQTPNFSNTPAQGMFQSRPFEATQMEKSQQPDLKTALMRAERYGHHLGRMHPVEVSAATSVQPKREMGQLAPSKLPHVVQQKGSQLQLNQARSIDLSNSQSDNVIQRQTQDEDLESLIHSNNQLLGHLEQGGQQQPTTPAVVANVNKPLPEKPLPEKPLPEKPLPALPNNQELGQQSGNVNPYDPARKNKRKGDPASGAQVATNVAGLIPGAMDAAKLLSPAATTAATGIGLPLSMISVGRDSRQAAKAYRRARIASDYAKSHRAESPDGQPASADNQKLAEIAQYTANKQKRRAQKLGTSATLGSVSGVAAATSLATGVVTPPGVAAGFVSLGAGAASLGPSVYGAGKAGYKKIKGTKGEHRTANATDVYELAKGGHTASLAFMQDIGILKKEARPSAEAKGFYAEDLQDESKREFIIKYTMQKMRS